MINNQNDILAKFDVISWLQKSTGNISLSRKNIDSLLTFALMWNLFEHKFFSESNNLNPVSLRELARKTSTNIKLQDYLIFLGHFQKRYTENKNKRMRKKRFNNLILSKSVRGNSESDRNFVKNTLKGQINEERVITTLFLIAHRFRNNFFHGRKNPITLQIYEQQFNVLNQFLAKFMEDTILKARIGLFR